MSQKKNLPDNHDVLLPSECRAARALLGWTQDDLAQWSLVHRMTVGRFEKGDVRAGIETTTALRNTFEQFGIMFGLQDGRFRTITNRARWLIAPGLGEGKLAPGDRIALFRDAAGDMICTVPGRDYVVPLAKPPLYGEWASAYGLPGDTGPIISITMRDDAQYNTVAEITFRPDITHDELS